MGVSEIVLGNVFLSVCSVISVVKNYHSRGGRGYDRKNMMLQQHFILLRNFMTKINFTKAEEILTERLRNITVNGLLEEADSATIQRNPSSSPDLVQTQKKQNAARSQIIGILKRDLEFLHKHGQSLYEKLKIKKSHLGKFIENPETLTEKEWVRIKEIKTHVEEAKKLFTESLPKTSDEDLINQQRKRHLKKRFNINEKWLPLK